MENTIEFRENIVSLQLTANEPQEDVHKIPALGALK